MNPFAFEWLVPSQPDRLTHATLLDRARPAPFSVAVGHGPDEAQALPCLWVTLKDDDAPAEAIDYVAAEYARRTGMVPKESPSDPGSARPTKRGLKKSVRR